MRHRLQFNDFDCEVVVGKYVKGGTSLELIAWDDQVTPSGDEICKGEPIATATVCIPCCGKPAGDEYVLIKDYSENEGMMDALVEAGYVTPTGQMISSGFVEIPVCQLHLPKEEKV